MPTDEGFSGLEAAILLIAFAVVAATLAYGILGSGFLATSKAQETTSQGMKSACSGVYIDGALHGTMSSVNNQLDKLMFYIAIPETGLDEDLSKMTMAYTQEDIPSPNSKSIGITADYDHFSVGTDGTVNPTSGPVILHAGEKTRINFANLNGPKATGFFSIEIKPREGSSYLLHRYLGEGYLGGIIR
jgi:archaeal flagellin FlaB